MKGSNMNEEPLWFTQFHQFLGASNIPIESVWDREGKPITKDFAYWRKKELLPFIPSGKHTYDVSLSDILWFKILDICRGFSFTIENTKKVCDYFFKDAYWNELPKQLIEGDKRALEKRKKEECLTKEDERALAFLEDSLKNDSYLYALKFQINYLTLLVTRCVSRQEEGAILIFMDGRVGELCDKDYQPHSKFKANPTEPHIRISISQLLQDLVDTYKEAKVFVPALAAIKKKQKNKDY